MVSIVTLRVRMFYVVRLATRKFVKRWRSPNNSLVPVITQHVPRCGRRFQAQPVLV